MVLSNLCKFCFFDDAPRDMQLRGLRVKIGLGDADGEVRVNAGRGGGASGGLSSYTTESGSTKEIIWSD